MDDIKFKAKFALNDYIETYTGKHFKVLFPDLETIDIEDIAHSLSMQCRYTGHSSKFYSIAEHCIHVASICPDEHKLWGLLHDASEAYLTDVAAPVKPYLTNYKDIENRLMEVICLKYNLDSAEPPIVKHCDLMLLAAEAELLMKSKGENWKFATQIDIPAIPNIDFKFYNPGEAKHRFLEMFEELNNESK